MYAIIETGGKQVKAVEGQEIYVEKVDAETNDSFTFENGLFIGEDDVHVVAPCVKGDDVTAKVEEHGHEKKITVYKFKKRKNYSRKQGHRQPFTKLVIDKINV